MVYKDEMKLVELCKSDIRFFSTLYENYVKDVYRYSYSIAGNRETAEDATSFAFLTALEKINTFQYKGISIKAWLFVISRNYIFKTGQKGMINLDPEIEVIDKDIDVIEKMMIDESAKQVNSELLKLSSIENEIIRLRTFEELSFSEISTILNIGKSKTKMIYYRSLQKLYKSISGN